MKHRKTIILLALCAFFLGMGSLSAPEPVSAAQIHVGVGIVVAPHHYRHHRRHRRSVFIAPRVVHHNDHHDRDAHHDRDDHHDNGEHRGDDRF